MDVVLVPGLWLDASCWRDVCSRLADAGHSPHPLSLRGFESRVSDRNGVLLADHVAEITAAIDRCAGAVLLVGHAEACGLVHAAVNRRAARIAHAVYVGGLPSADGTHVLSGFARDPHDKSWDEEEPVDLPLRRLRERALDNAAYVLDSVQHLTDPSRFEVPVTIVATEFTGDDVRRWMRRDIDPARELADLADVTIVDLPSGRWPQMGHAGELAEILLSVSAVRRAPIA